MEWDKSYKEAKRILLALENQLVSLESGDTSVMLQTKVAGNLHTLSQMSARLQTDLDQLPAAKREVCAIKVQQLVAEHKSVKDSIEKRLHQLQQAQRQDMRNSLHQRHGQGGNTEMLLDAYADESRRLKETQDTADELLDMIGVLHVTVKDQNQALKRVKKKVLDMVNQFELSRSLLRMIERRSRADQIMIYSGMVFILLLMLILWWYF